MKSVPPVPFSMKHSALSALRGRSRPDVFALLIVLFATALSLIDLAGQSLWTDEGMAWWVARLPVGEQLALLRETAPNPLHYLALGGWMRAAGSSEFALRFLSVLGAALAVALIYRLGRELGGRRAGLIAAALLAVNPLRVYYAQEARAYGWLAALTLASALLLWRSRRGLSWPEVAMLGALQALTVLAHPYGAFALVALNLVMFGCLLSASRGHLARWAAAGLIAAALAGAWYAGALGAISGSAGSAIYYRGRLPATAVIADALRSYVLGFTGAGGDGWLLLAPALIAGLLALLFTRHRWPWLFILAGCVAPVAGILLLSGDRERYAPRYVIAGALFFCLLVAQLSALGFARRGWGATAYGLAVMVLGYGMMWGALGQLTDPALARPDFRSVAAYIQAHGDPQRDAIAVVGGHFAPVMRYYLDAAGYDLHPLPPDLIQNVDRPLRYADLELLNRAAAGRERIWLALWQRELADPGGIVLDELLRVGGRREVSGDFGEINLLLFDVPPGARFETDPQPAHPTEYVWGDALALRGFDLAPAETIRPGETLNVTFHWLPRAAMDRDYLASAQLIGPDGKLYAQADHMAHSDFYPTSLWRAGEPVLDRYVIAVPADTPPGDYALNVVLYDRTGARWLTGGQEFARLGAIRVAP
jgi:hypothetical protein